MQSRRKNVFLGKGNQEEDRFEEFAIFSCLQRTNGSGRESSAIQGVDLSRVERWVNVDFM